MSTSSIYGFLGNRDANAEINDYYATDPKAVRLLCEEESFNNSIWEPACGEGHLSKELIKQGYTVRSTDLIDRGYGDEQLNFFNCTEPWSGDIITNPPYSFTTEWVYKGMELLEPDYRMALFLKIQFLETKKRRELMTIYPPEMIYAATNRIKCAKNGRFDLVHATAALYAWFIWRKGFNGITQLRLFN